MLKEDSVLAALIVYLQRICENNAGNRLRMSVAFKVLAGPFNRPLPPLDWRVLLPIAEQYVRQQILSIKKKHKTNRLLFSFDRI